MGLQTDTNSRFIVQIAEGSMSATISLKPGTNPRKIDAQDILDELDAHKIAITDAVKHGVAELLERFQENPDSATDSFLIAEGEEPVNSEDAAFIWAEELQQKAADWAEDDAIDFYNISSVITVEAETLIGHMDPPKPGIEGVDVLGRTIPIPNQPTEITLGEGVELGGDSRSVYATASGKVVFDKQEISIVEIVEIRGDVDFEIGNLDVNTDIVITGTIHDLFKVKTAKNLTVGGTIEGAEVNVAGDVNVRGGIINRHKGKVIAGGEIATKFCEESDLQAQKDIRIAKESMNSKVHSENKVQVERGAIIGGEVFARQGIEVKTIGSDMNIPTAVMVGLHPRELRKARDAEKNNAQRQAAVNRTQATTHIR